MFALMDKYYIPNITFTLVIKLNHNSVHHPIFLFRGNNCKSKTHCF